MSRLRKTTKKGEKSAPSPHKGDKENERPARAPKLDPYADLENRKSAFAELTDEARDRAEASKIIRVDAVPVGERRSDKRKAKRICDGSKAERVAMHGKLTVNGEAEEEEDKGKKTKKKKNKKNGVKQQENGEQSKKDKKKSKKAEKTNGVELPSLADAIAASMDNFVSKRNKRARRQDDEAEDEPLVVIPYGNGGKRRKLASGVVVEEPDEEVLVVESPDEDDDGSKKKKKRKARRSDFGDVDFEAFNAQMNEQQPYDEEEDDDFDMSEIEDEDEMSDEEIDDEDVDEDDDDFMDEEIDEAESDELDEDEVEVRPEDIQRVIYNGGVMVEDGESEEEEEEEDSGVDEEEEEEEDGDSSDSSHVSDDSYQDAVIEDGERAHELVRTPSPKKASRELSVDFIDGFPFATEDSAVAASKALGWMICPCDNQTFYEDFFQSNSLVVHRNDSNYYGNLFSSQQMMEVLRENHLEYGINVNLAMYKNGVRTTHNGTGRAYPLSVADAIRNGCSVQLTNPQAFSPSIWQLCDLLQEMFHCFVGANTYITPAGSSGFAPHWDEIDAFILQVEGRKYWKVYAPQTTDDELPLESSDNFTDADLADRKPSFEGWLEQGDMLYIPRGFIHQARTDPKVHSLHVTVSAGRQWTYANLLKKFLPDALDSFTDTRMKMRKQLPPGLFDMAGVAEFEGGHPLEESSADKIMNPLDRHMSQFRRWLNGMYDSGVDMMAREFMRTALPPVLNHEEKQLSAWGNEGADLFQEKGSTRISKKSEVRFIRRHGQRIIFETDDKAFIVHRMANDRSYEGREEQKFDLETEEISAFEMLQSNYPDWTGMKDLELKSQKRELFLHKLFNNGLIMVRTP